jgi:hypothetical protein
MGKKNGIPLLLQVTNFVLQIEPRIDRGEIRRGRPGRRRREGAAIPMCSQMLTASRP